MRTAHRRNVFFPITSSTPSPISVQPGARWKRNTSKMPGAQSLDCGGEGRCRRCLVPSAWRAAEKEDVKDVWCRQEKIPDTEVNPDLLEGEVSIASGRDKYRPWCHASAQLYHRSHIHGTSKDFCDGRTSLLCDTRALVRPTLRDDYAMPPVRLNRSCKKIATAICV